MSQVYSNELTWFDRFINLLFGCRHPDSRLSRPFTRDGRTYCVCLKCGLSADYSLVDFCLITPRYLRYKDRQEALLARENSHVQLDTARQLMV